MKLSTLAALLQGQLIGSDRNYTSLSIDSRSIEPGSLFIAIAGERFDGHAFIEHAKKQGAVAALVEKTISSTLPLVRVADTRKALGQLAQAHRQQFSIPLIALTGSSGKTSTKEMIRVILNEMGAVLANIKNFNNDIGVPLTLLNLTAQHRYAVIEMGANHAGEIAYLSQITQPNVALITNIGPAHLQGFGSMAGVAKAKAEIFSGLAEEGIAIINADDSYSNTWEKELAGHHVVRFGLSTKGEFSATNITMDAEGKVSFLLGTPTGELFINLPLVGSHHVMNALAAAAATFQVGIPLSVIKSGLAKVQPVSGRMMLSKTNSGAIVIDDSYNANPSSVAVALELLAHYSGRRILVMGDMGELGESAAQYHQQIGQLAKKLGIDEVYTYGELTAVTASAFGAGKHYRNQQELILALKPSLQNKDVVLIKGSRFAKMENIVAALKNNTNE